MRTSSHQQLFTRMSCGAIATLSALGLLAGCADSNSSGVTIAEKGTNIVSYWNDVATKTINVPATTTGTPEEQRPSYSSDLATVHVALYDAIMAITGDYKPYAVTTKSDAAGASQEAAASAAAYGVLKGLFPARSSQYQAPFDSYIAGVADGAAKTKGLVLGAEVASGILALRLNDGRSVTLAAYIPGTTPGAFRGTNPVNRFAPFMKPFALTSASQFRASGPPALDSATYARDLEETRTLGSATSSVRTEAQTEIARFSTESPPTFWPRNIRRFSTTERNLSDHARAMALLWVVHADATIACFDSKYFYQFWRPTSAIALADTDSNPATTADTAWAPVVPTPNHPEYPAAHACVSAATARALQKLYGTGRVNFAFDSTVTGLEHAYDSTDAMEADLQLARIYGGMHFRTSLEHGAAIGHSVADWTAQNYFQRREVQAQ